MFYYIINKKNSLIYNYGQRTSKYGLNILIQKFSYNYDNISYECLCLYPFGCIIYNY